MSMSLPNNKLGAKIRWEQIEDGYLVLDIIHKFATMETELRKISNTQNETIKELTDTIDNLNKQVESLSNSYEEFVQNYKNEINEKVGDFQKAIDALKQYCDETFYKKSDKIGLGDLDGETTALFDGILNTIEELKTMFSDITYDYDKDNVYRKVLWTVYFEASTDHVIYLKNIDGFKEDMTRYITMEDFYGANYAINDFGGENVQVFCYGPTGSFITDVEALAPDYLDRAIQNIKLENPKSVYVPRTNVPEDGSYAVHPVFGTIGYKIETRAFDVAKVTTTNYLFKVVKFLDNKKN